MKNCKFDGSIMEETIKDYGKFKIKEYLCSKCGHYYFKKLEG